MIGAPQMGNNVRCGSVPPVDLFGHVSSRQTCRFEALLIMVEMQAGSMANKPPLLHVDCASETTNLNVAECRRCPRQEMPT